MRAQLITFNLRSETRGKRTTSNTKYLDLFSEVNSSQLADVWPVHRVEKPPAMQTARNRQFFWLRLEDPSANEAGGVNSVFFVVLVLNLQI